MSAAAGCSSGDRSDAEPPEAGRREERATAATGESPEPPQLVLLVSLDTVRADRLGLYGYERFTSPVLDSLARESVVFDDANAASPWTLPSHASILTGLFPLAHGVMSVKTRLPEAVPTLASMLQAEGFDTAAVVNVSWLKKESFELTRDFAEYLFVDAPASRRAPNTWVTDQAMQWLGDLGERRLFLFLHYYDAHSDYASLPEFEQLFVGPYEGEADGTGWQLQRALMTDSYVKMCHESFDAAKCSFSSRTGARYVDESVEKMHFDEDDMRHLTDLYDAGIRQLDTELGRLFGFLTGEGFDDRTLLIVTSDHGEEFLDHGSVDHFLSTYQEVLRVPLLIRGPGIPRGVRVAAPVSSVDIAPTVLAAINGEIPESLDGLDLSALWRGEPPRAFAERFIYGEGAGGLSWQLKAEGFFPIRRSVRRGRHKLLYSSIGDRVELYDLEADPHETVDISQQEPQLTAELAAELHRRYTGVTAEPSRENAVELDPEDVRRLQSLGYIP